MSLRSLSALVLLATASVALAQEIPKVPASTQPALPAYLPQNQPLPPAAALPPYELDPNHNYTAFNAFGDPVFEDGSLGSTYIPLDSWIYPELLRLYSMGYLKNAFLSMRPWTRRSVVHMLTESEVDIQADGNDQALEIVTSVLHELAAELTPRNKTRGRVYGTENVYLRGMWNHGDVLRNSYHVGQSYINDYGRLYGSGFNNYDGFNSIGEWGRFSIHLRGEFQHGAAFNGYSQSFCNLLTNQDGYPCTAPNFPNTLIPVGPQASQNAFRIVDGYVSFHLLNHEISGGKSDVWFGPNRGAGMAWSNNAENIYSFRINRVEPLSIPLLHYILGPVRYDFVVGSLKGHTYPNSPWVHAEMISFAPTSNFQFGFERTVIWGGKGHEPVTIHTFLQSFFSVSDTNVAEKFSVKDPGARFSAFNFSYRLPYLRRWLTLTVDSETHDDVFPISAPRRAAIRAGLDLSHIPGAPKWEMRVEGVMTDPRVSRSTNGSFMYYETVQRQGYTNNGFLFGDWMGREGKGGQAWLTYHMSPTEFVEFEYRRKKNAKDFIPEGTTQNTYTVNVVKRFHRDIAVNALFSYEDWKAPALTDPALNPGSLFKNSSNTLPTVNFGVTWYPELHRKTGLQ